MRKAVVLFFCQICWQENHNEIGVDGGLSVTIDGVDLDLCADHGARIPIKMLPIVLQDYGIKTGPFADKIKKHKPPKAQAQPNGKLPERDAADGKWPCPRCTQRSLSPQGRGAHLRSRHGIAGSSYSTVAKQRADEARAAQVATV